MKSLVIKHEASISPQKMNLVAELVRKKELAYSLKILLFSNNKSGRIIHKLLSGAKKSLEKEKELSSDFYVDRLEINRGKIQKRLIYRAKGRADRIRKRSSLIKLLISKKENFDSVNYKNNN